MIIAAYVYPGENGFTGLRPGDAERLTHVNMAFALVKDGKGSVDHWHKPESIKEFIKNKGHLKVVLSVGGWGAGGFSPAVATAEGRELLAQTLVDISNDFGFDGIDLDWEYPCNNMAGIEASPDDKENYTLWVQLIREKLGPDKILSMAAGGMQSCVDSLELEKLEKEMDFINLMTYDMCPWNKTGYHTALFPSEAGSPSTSHVADIYVKGGFPHGRLVIGSAFYGRLYKDADGLNMPITTPPTGLGGGYTRVKERIAKAGLQYDEVAEAPYVYDAEAREFITFDNPRSIEAKVKFVKETGLGGIMFWSYAGDDEDSTLLKAMAGK
jgi:chitinase